MVRSRSRGSRSSGCKPNETKDRLTKQCRPKVKAGRRKVYGPVRKPCSQDEVRDKKTSVFSFSSSSAGSLKSPNLLLTSFLTALAMSSSSAAS
jgi:hypothetical protein